MTDRDKKLLAIFAVVIMLGGYWFLVLGKKRSAVKEAEAAKVSAQTALDEAIAKESAGKAEKKKYPVKYSRVLKMGKAIPVDSDFASLMVQVNDISDDSNVTFLSLTNLEAGGDATKNAGPTGKTTCEAVTGSSDATAGASASTGATGATSAVVQPSAAVSGTGKTINKAKAGEETASNDANRAAASTEAKCATSPTLTDVTAQTSGLRVFNYSFTFNGSFYNLHKVFDGLLGMVNAKNGKVNVTGRLLQINGFTMSVKEFPTLEAQVEMTGYALPVGTTIAAGATASGPAGASASASASTTTRTDSTVTSDAPPSAAILGGK